jgi:hypothetical protein
MVSLIIFLFLNRSLDQSLSRIRAKAGRKNATNSAAMSCNGRLLSTATPLFAFCHESSCQMPELEAA